jgi:hypothetical protein
MTRPHLAAPCPIPWGCGQKTATPQKPERHRNRYLHQGIEYRIHLRHRQAARLQVLRPSQDRLVFED